MATKEFFALAPRAPRPGGIVAVNVGHPEGSDDLEKALGATMAEAFPTVLRDPVEDVNTILIGTAAEASPADCGTPPGTCAATSRGWRGPRPSGSSRGCAGGEVWTDDRAPVEWLTDQTFLGYAAEH